jgi:uncharacterized membrane protein YphA (DoxX/SURF4 family)
MQHSIPGESGDAKAKQKAEIRRIVLGTFQLILGGTFVYASLGKIIHPQNFIKAISSYRILPDFLVNVVGYLLPWIEILFGIALIVGVATRVSAMFLSILLAIFIIALLSALLRGIDIDCGCFGTRGLSDSAVTNSSSQILLAIFRDFLLLILALWLTFMPTRFRNYNRS